MNILGGNRSNHPYTPDPAGPARSAGAEGAVKLKLTDWKKEPSLIELKNDLQATVPSQQAMSTKIKRWIDTRKVQGDARPKTLENRSKVQPKLVRKQAEWRYSALSEPFLGSDKLFTIEPRTAEDEEGARQNELLLNWQFKTKMNSVKFIDDFVRTTVDEGTCFIKVSWIRKTRKFMRDEPVYTFMVPETEEEAAPVQQALQLKQDNPRGYAEMIEQAPEIGAAVDFSLANGQLAVAYATGEVTQVEDEMVILNHPVVEVVDYRNVYVDPSCNGDLDRAKFVIFSFETCKADLQKDGRYTNLDAVNFQEAGPLNGTANHSSNTPGDFNFRDEPRKLVVAYEYWGFYDVEGNGELIPIVATWIGDVLIRMEVNPYPDEKIPLVAVTYMPLKKSVYGEADAELLEENQNILGAMTRGALDIMARSANGQRGFANGTLDTVNRRRFERGEDYMFNPVNGDPRNAIVLSKMEEIPASALNMMQLANMEAESLTGVKAFSGGLSGEAYGKVAAGIKGMLDAASKREMSILRRLAQGMVEIGRKVSAMNAVFLSEQEVVRVTNAEYVVIRREDLKGDYDFKVDIATAEVDEAKSQDLGFMLQTLGPEMGWEIRNMLLAEIARLKRMPKLAREIKSYKPQPDPMAEKAKMLEIQKMELENMKLQAEVQELQTKAALNQAKAVEAQALADQANLDFVEQETGTKHARTMDELGAQARANQDLEITKSLLAPRKKEEQKGDLNAALGFNALSDARNSV